MTELPSGWYYRISWENATSLGVLMAVDCATVDGMLALVGTLMRPDVAGVVKVVVEPMRSL